jgi:hypothetical protein
VAPDAPDRRRALDSGRRPTERHPTRNPEEPHLEFSLTLPPCALIMQSFQFVEDVNRQQEDEISVAPQVVVAGTTCRSGWHDGAMVDHASRTDTRPRDGWRGHALGADRSVGQRRAGVA